MKNKLVLFLSLCVLAAKAQNIEVSGRQSGVWDADTVFVTGNVLVEDELLIGAGTVVIFNDYYGISAADGAMLSAIGTETDSILFTVTDTTGFHIFNTGRGGWNGIRLDKAGNSRFDYCRFQYGKASANDDQDGGALRIFNCADVNISNSTLFCNFSREHGGALSAEDSKVTMRGCNVSNNLTYSNIDTIYYMYGGGLRFLKCDVDITETCFFHNNGQTAIGGAMSLDSCTVNIDRCRFEYNYGLNGGGLYLLRSNGKSCRIANSLFANNTSGHFGGGLAIAESSPLISNVTVTRNLSIGVNCGGIFFFQDSSPELWNCIVHGNFNNIPIDEPVQMWTWTYEGYIPEFHNCLVQFGLNNISNNENIVVYENCLDDDPLFADPDNGDFRLCEGSPCIDAGAPETPTDILNGSDLDGHARLAGNGIDLGAYEFHLTNVGETAQKEQLFHIVGNPITASSYAEIELDDACRLTANVYSIDGKLLISKDLGIMQKGFNRIGIGEIFLTLAKGTYIVELRCRDKVLVAKAIR